MIKRFFAYIVLPALCCAHCAAVVAAEPPRLVINIVAGSLDAGSLARYAPNFGERGFKRLLEEGAVFENARYGCMQTTTPVSLATISTGATPAIHGVTGDRWVDPSTNKVVELTADTRSHSVLNRDGEGGHSPANLIAPTLADAMMRADSSSRAVTVAVEPMSAVVLAGRSGTCLWIDPKACRWTTSTAYASALPGWVSAYNGRDWQTRFLTGPWTSRYGNIMYLNKRRYDITMNDSATGTAKSRAAALRKLSDYEKIAQTPAGNSILLDFARTVVASLDLGGDKHPDLLNIYFDAPRNIAERYGTESVEYEDMLYRLDSDLGEFLDYVNAYVKNKETVLVVFTADHGSSPSFDLVEHDERDRFNARQFEVIMNAYIGAKFGQGEWVTGYMNHALYINRNLAHERNIPIADIQDEAAMFATQFRGISHAMSARSLASGAFANGYARKMQNGYFPRRSGDVLINLMPDWIEQRDGIRSMSGSMYEYDVHVPLIFCGAGIKAAKHKQHTDITSVAPTIASILGIMLPSAAEGEILDMK